jgi:hypothetical protein
LHALVNEVCVDNAGLYCSDYDSANNKCNACEQDYYVNADGICAESKVTNCLTHTVGADTCDACINGFNLEADGTCKEPPKPANCDTYCSTDATLCDKCASHYYLSVDKKSCITGNIVNCMEFDTSVDPPVTCTLCDP